MKTFRNHVMRTFSGWLALLACAMLLAACGGGGGNPGTVTNSSTTTTTTSKVASVVLIADADTILATGADGTEVTLTAVVKDANNNVLVGETVDFSATSGAITNTNRVTDSSGTVTEKLSVKGDSSLRAITITAKAGSVTSAAKVVTVVAATSSVASVQLTSSSGTLQSAGGNSVSLVALVKDSNNGVVPNVPVSFSADSGSLSETSVTTNAKGIATVTLDTVNDPSLRTITATASSAGRKSSTQVSVVGTKITVSGASTVNQGASIDVTAKVLDSAGTPLTNKPVTFSSSINSLAVKGGGAAFTNASGQIVLTYTATTGSSDTIVIKAMGDTATVGVTINSSNFTVNVVDGSGQVQSSAAINTCQKILVHNDLAGVPQTGNVSVDTSRGSIYIDSACTTTSPTNTVAFVAGNATAYIKASSSGPASLTATAATSGTSVQGTVEFVAPLTAQSTVTLQADPAIIGVNSGSSTTQQSVLRAVVRDGTAQNNLVKDATISFSIQTDPSGGRLTLPTVVKTGSDGAASVVFIAGSAATAVDGVTIQAQIQGVSTNSTTAKLTVAQQALFISAGTGNVLSAPNSSVYTKDFAVFVTDAAGNPKSGVSITAAVRPRNYFKGKHLYLGTTGPWLPQYSATCPNEDLNGDGFLNAGEDVNGNGRLDPGIPVTMTPTAQTDSAGMATISISYPKDRANWLDVDFTIRGQVAGTEATYVGYTLLNGLAADYTSATTSPPGATSPYGVGSLCTDTN